MEIRLIYIQALHEYALQLNTQSDIDQILAKE